jgi:regulator of replication initiation timing
MESNVFEQTKKSVGKSLVELSADLQEIKCKITYLLEERDRLLQENAELRAQLNQAH